MYRFKSLLIPFLLFAVISCKTTLSFPAKEGPISKTTEMKDWTTPKDQIKVISFNIEYAKKIEEAVEELQSTPELQDPDILLLQEMNESGCQEIANRLGLNYVYYPATINSNAEDFFGNAILSKWPISDEQKWVLPYPNPHNKGIRIFMNAQVNINDKVVHLFNVHSETIVRGGKKRLKQHQLIAEKIAQLDTAQYVILGGDFNTFFKKNIRQSVQLFESIGLTWTNAKVGHTAESFIFNKVSQKMSPTHSLKVGIWKMSQNPLSFLKLF